MVSGHSGLSTQPENKENEPPAKKANKLSVEEGGKGKEKE